MSSRDRVATLRLIERIRRQEMEVVGARLAAIRSEETALEAHSAALSARAAEEARNSTDDTRPYLPGFISAVDAQQRLYAEERDRLAERAARHETELLQSFQATKTAETVLHRAERTVKEEEDRAEAQALDDITRTLFLKTRKAANAG